MRSYLNGVKTVLFDFDDTLVDESYSIRRRWQTVLSKFPLPGFEEKFLEIFDQKGFRYKKHVNDALEAVGIPEEEGKNLISEMVEAFLNTASTDEKKTPGSLEVLTWLRNKKVPRGILTNGKKSLVQPRIQAAGFSSLVEHTVYGDDFQKPAPEIFRQSMDLLKPAHPSEILYVGDSFHEDIEGAVRSGLKACWIKTDARHPEIREFSRPVLVMPGLSGLLKLFQNG